MPYALAEECNHHQVMYYFLEDGERKSISVKTSLLPEAITQSDYKEERITEVCSKSLFNDDFDWSESPCKNPGEGAVYAVPYDFEIRFLIDNDVQTRHCEIYRAYEFIQKFKEEIDDGICSGEYFVNCAMAYEQNIPEWCTDSCGYTHTECNKTEKGLCIINDLNEFQIKRGDKTYNCSDILGVDPIHISRVKSNAERLSDCVLAGGAGHVYEDNAGRYTFESSECSQLYCTDLTSNLCTSV